MNAEEVISVLKSLPTVSLTDANQSALNARIESCAKAMTKLNKNVVIAKGSTSSGSQRQQTRLYVEWKGNPSRDSRHHNCAVIDFMEFETRNKYGFHPISRKGMFELCDWLESLVVKLKGKRSPVKQ